MMDVMRIHEGVSVGPQPDRDDLSELARAGFKSVVNLRAEGEPDQALSVEEEGELVRSAGLEYLSVPVTMDGMNPELVDSFRARLAALPAPVFVHCHKGMRAGAFVMMDVACKSGMSGEELLERAQSMGFACDVPALKRFVCDYVNAHTGEAQ